MYTVSKFLHWDWPVVPVSKGGQQLGSLSDTQTKDRRRATACMNRLKDGRKASEGFNNDL